MLLTAKRGKMLKKFTRFVAIILSFVMLFGGVHSALAYTTPAPALVPTRISNPP
jgi:hypothetical protein